MRKRRMAALLLGGCMLLTAGCQNKAEKAFSKGVEAYQSGNYEGALTYFNEAIQENPQKAEYYLEEGAAFMATEQYENAREAFSHAITDNGLAIVKENKKRALRLIGICYYREEDYKSAVDYFEKALEIPLLLELDSDINRYLAAAYEPAGMYEKGIARNTEILIEDPENVPSLMTRGRMYLELGENEKALSDFEKVIDVVGNSFEAQYGRYRAAGIPTLLYKQQDIMQEMAQIRGLTGEQNYYVAKLLFTYNMLDDALLKMQKAVQDGFMEAEYYVAEIYRKMEDSEEAVFHYRSYLENTQKEDAVIYNQMAICLMDAQKYSEAKQAISEGMQCENADKVVELYLSDIAVEEKLGNYNKAYEKAKAYVLIFPENPDMLREYEFLKTRAR